MSRPDQLALRRRTRLAEGVLAAIVVLGAVVVGSSIVSGPLFSRPYDLRVDLPDAAGLHVRSDVAYRGQHVGTVTAVELTASGVRATLAIDEGVQIPRDTEVVVANLSAVGEQYVDLRPRTDAGPFLADGSVLDASRAVLPLPTWRVLADTQHLLRRIDVRDIRTISREVEAVFGHGDVDLVGLAREVGRTMTVLEDLSPRVFALLAHAQTPLRTMDDLSPELRTFVGNALRISERLRRVDPVIARLIDQGALVIPIVTEGFRSTQPILVDLLADGTPVAVMARAHLPGLLHWYTWGPRQMVAMAAATRSGTGHVILVPTPAKNCRYGPEVSPYQRNVPLPLSARCTTVSPRIQQRGSQNVPIQ